MTTQELQKIIDLSAASVPITGTQMNQLLETARPAADRGFIISTEDNVSTPDVPDPDGLHDGIIPVWWKRYIWRRQMTAEVRSYVWDNNAPSDPTFLQWVQLDSQGATALTTANTALANSVQAETNASSAVATANAAETQAQNAQSEVDNLDLAVSALGTRVTAVETDLARYQPGDVRCSAGTFTYSSTEDQGWLPADGSSVSITTFARLFAVFGYTYGGSGGVFNMPDLRGRTIVGAGTGSGLTARTLKETGGAERVKLAAAESGVAAHKHQISIEQSIDADVTASAKTLRSTGAGGDTAWEAVASTKVGETRDVAAAEAANSHENMPPFLVLNYYIKT